MKVFHANLVASIMIVSLPAMAQERPAIDETLVAYLSTADSVRLDDGRAFHFVCVGEGSPTVIFTAGLGDWSAIWNKAQPAIARTTRTCAWDRPGFGLSDGSEARPTVATNTADLETALRKAKIEGPYIMVGHSLGAFESLLFADRNRDKVAGMLLVDPSIPDQARITQSVTPLLYEQGEISRQAFVAALRRCAQSLRAGNLQSDGPDPDNCFGHLPDYPASVRAALSRARSKTQFETKISFFEATTENGLLVINPQRDYGDMPLTVLTASALPPESAIPAATFAQIKLFRQEFARGHERYAALSTRGAQLRVPTGHYIHTARPQEVIDAIEAVITQAREAGN